MKTILPKTKQPRKPTRINVIAAKLWRRAGDPNWMLTITKPGDRITLATRTPHQAAAQEFALVAVRQITSLVTPKAPEQEPVAQELFDSEEA